jgi:hypothetical protein
MTTHYTCKIQIIRDFIRMKVTPHTQNLKNLQRESELHVIAVHVCKREEESLRKDGGDGGFQIGA